MVADLLLPPSKRVIAKLGAKDLLRKPLGMTIHRTSVSEADESHGPLNGSESIPHLHSSLNGCSDRNGEGDYDAAPRLSNGHVKNDSLLREVLSQDVADECRQFPSGATILDEDVTRTSESECETVVSYVDYFVIIGYFLLHMFGYLKDFSRRLGFEEKKIIEERGNLGFTPLYSSWEAFMTRNVYVRIRDCWNRPICSVPGEKVTVMERATPDSGWSFQFTGVGLDSINMGSYNYLGFADKNGKCADDATAVIDHFAVTGCSPRNDLGTQPVHLELEELCAKFVGCEAAITFGMGFATNSMNILALVDNGCAVLSDALNHCSIVTGVKLSGASVKTFRHNDMVDLERKLIELVIAGHPRTRRPFKKILIIVEGLYSMEGSICKLPEIIALKKKYQAYVFLDEAHSIGALGPRGRGVVDYFGLDPHDVDIMMGTFSKSFGAVGGYIAGSRDLIQYLKTTSGGMIYSSAMPPPVAQQIISSMTIIMGDNGLKRISQLAENTRYFRRELKKRGFIVYGHRDSPVVPLLLYYPTRMACFGRFMLQRGVAVVVVGFPATPLRLARARFCLSAAHTREMLDKVIAATDDVGDILNIRYSRKNGPSTQL